jgi:lysine 2,3-aminomutase
MGLSGGSTMNKNQQLQATASNYQPQTSITSEPEWVGQDQLNPPTHIELQRVAERFAVAVTPAMRDAIDPTNPDDPLAKQFLPDVRELNEYSNELSDPIGDESHSPVTGIVHRYPDRLLLTPIRVCPVYCRFCFRREHVGNNAPAMLTQEELQTAISYIREHTEIWEVILSGGDPLLMSPRRLRDIIEQLEAIEHVKIIRIHTRVPVVDPDRISTDLIKALQSNKAVYVVLHSNHPNEMTPAAQKACAQLVNSGLPMLSQSVLLKGINDNPDTLEKLMRTLVENRIKPYYLHHPDRARGTHHFRTSIDAGQKLMADLRGRVSGLCQPEYVLDIPGGAGKTPVGPQWIEPNGTDGYTVTDYNGAAHQYMDDTPDKAI